MGPKKKREDEEDEGTDLSPHLSGRGILRAGEIWAIAVAVRFGRLVVD